MSKLAIEGEVDAPLALDRAALAALSGQVPDLSVEIPGRDGVGVRLAAILERARPRPGATHATLISADGGFSASVALDELGDAIVAYRRGEAPLSPAEGGPFRFFIPRAEGCAPDAASRCANVKHLASIRLTAGSAADGRPRSEAEHARLHRHEGR